MTGTGLAWWGRGLHRRKRPSPVLVGLREKRDLKMAIVTKTMTMTVIAVPPQPHHMEFTLFQAVL